MSKCDIVRAIHGTDYFDEDYAFALLLLNDVVFLNDFWYKDAWPASDRLAISVNVVCNDVFCRGADAVPLSYREICDLYNMWQKDKIWGAVAWCIKARKEMPQKLVEDKMREAGWDLDALVLNRLDDAET